MAKKLPQSLTEMSHSDALSQAFRASRIKFTLGYGLLTAMSKPALAKALELHARHISKKQAAA